MARKAQAKSTRKRAAPGPATPDRIIDAAMTAAGRDGWRRLSLAAIAEEAGVSLSELHRHFTSKGAVLRAFVDRVDDTVLSGTDPRDAGEPVHDRLLDVLMRRFEALGPHKDAVAAMVRSGPVDPAAGLCMGPRLARSMAWSLEAAGVSSTGLAGRLRVNALAAIYLTAMMVWLRDDSPDMGRTMANLDRNLKRAQSLISLLPGGRPRPSPASS